MTLDGLHTVEIIETMENFLESVRPPVDIRSKLDITYTIEGQSVIINEVRPRWDRPNEYRQYAVAKATYVRAKNHWKVFWQRANLKWYVYPPKPSVKTLQEFVRLVKEDKHHCFWG
jgi:hypothetical protein